MSVAPSGPVRVVVYPGADQVNHYIRMYFRALEPCGVSVVGPLKFNDTHLRAHADEFDLMHFHWAHADLWRLHGGGAVGAAKALAGLWRFLRLARKLGKRVVWTVHDLEHLITPMRVDRFGNALLARMADVVICHTEATRDRLVKRYWGNPRTAVVMPHGNYDGAFPPGRPRAETLARYGLDPAKPLLVAAGSVRKYKGYDVAIEAARRLGLDYQMILAGEPWPLEPDLEPGLKAAAAGLPNVRLDLTRIDDAALADLYQAADCVLLPYSQITASGALLTALTLGRAVVVTDLPFFRSELATEPDAAVFVAPGDPAALADGVKRFFASDVPARHAAARRLADRLAWPTVVKPVVERLRLLFPGRIAEGPR